MSQHLHLLVNFCLWTNFKSVTQTRLIEIRILQRVSIVVISGRYSRKKDFSSCSICVPAHDQPTVFLHLLCIPACMLVACAADKVSNRVVAIQQIYVVLSKSSRKKKLSS